MVIQAVNGNYLIAVWLLYDASVRSGRGWGRHSFCRLENSRKQKRVGPLFPPPLMDVICLFLKWKRDWLRQWASIFLNRNPPCQKSNQPSQMYMYTSSRCASFTECTSNGNVIVKPISWTSFIVFQLTIPFLFKLASISSPPAAQ